MVLLLARVTTSHPPIQGHVLHRYPGTWATGFGGVLERGFGAKRPGARAIGILESTVPLKGHAKRVAGPLRRSSNSGVELAGRWPAVRFCLYREKSLAAARPEQLRDPRLGRHLALRAEANARDTGRRRYGARLDGT